MIAFLLLTLLPVVANAQREFLRGDPDYHPKSAVFLQQEQEPTPEPQTSVLWGKDGELWDPENSLLQDFTDCGYALGNEPIPEWPVWEKSIGDFGGVPNDDVSDLDALRRAIAEVPLNHTLLIPDGLWIIDDELVISRNNFVLKGESRDRTILFFPKHMAEVKKIAKTNKPFIIFQGGELRGFEDISLMLRDEKKATGYWRDPTMTKMFNKHWYYGTCSPQQL